MSYEKRAVFCVVLAAAVLLGGCDSAGSDEAAAWLDLGTIAGVGSVRGVAVVGDTVIVGTDDGVWRRGLSGTAAWVQSGLDGLDVRALRAAPDEPGVVFAGIDPKGAVDQVPFYRSTDGGRTWTGSGTGLYDEFSEGYVSVEDVTTQPGTDGAVLFANLQGASVVRSNDGGQSWEVVHGSLDGFGYPCVLHIPAHAPDVLYQGCEAPLDDAWIRTYDISDSNLTELGEGDKRVGIDEISNRRPNTITSFANVPGTVFAGLEGAVIALNEDDWRWVWKTEGEEGSGYTYVKFIWADPSDPEHLVFGGGDGDASENTRAGLYETIDGGDTVVPMEGPPGMNFNVGGVRAGASIPGGRDFVLVALSPSGARVLVRQQP